MKPLNLKETALKEEMKERCLTKGQYIDENAKAKFEMLCHLEDFEVQYWELQQENKQLKEENQKLKSQLAGTTFCYDEEEHRKLENNWNELKRWLYEDHCLYVPEIARNSTYQKVLEKMYEIEKESNSNEI